MIVIIDDGTPPFMIETDGIAWVRLLEDKVRDEACPVMEVSWAGKYHATQSFRFKTEADALKAFGKVTEAITLEEEFK